MGIDATTHRSIDRAKVTTPNVSNIATGVAQRSAQVDGIEEEDDDADDPTSTSNNNNNNTTNNNNSNSPSHFQLPLPNSISFPPANNNNTFISTNNNKLQTSPFLMNTNSTNSEIQRLFAAWKGSNLKQQTLKNTTINNKNNRTSLSNISKAQITKPTARKSMITTQKPKTALVGQSTLSDNNNNNNNIKNINGSVKLPKLLKILTKDQLCNLIVNLSNTNSNLENQLRASLPKFDITSTIQESSKLMKQVHRSFPHTRYVSTYDHQSFVKVRPYQTNYINFVTKPLKILTDAKQFDDLINYLTIVIEEACDLPNWSTEADRKPKKNLFKRFGSYLFKAMCHTTSLDMTTKKKLYQLCVTLNTDECGQPFDQCVAFLSQFF